MNLTLHGGCHFDRLNQELWVLYDCSSTLSHGWYIMHSPSSQHDEHVSIVTLFFGVHYAI